MANTGADRVGWRPDVEALSALGAGISVVPVTDDPNPTTVILAGEGEVAADEWVARGRPGRRLAVRLAGRPTLNPDLQPAIAGADGTVIGPDDADLVVDAVLKVLAQGGLALPAPIIAAGHDHHRFEGFAHHHLDEPNAEAVLALLVPTR